MYLLDTNIISEIRKIKKNKTSQKFIDWFKSIHCDQCYTTPVVLMEIERGILNIKHKDHLAYQQLIHWYNNVILPMFNGRILMISQNTASICAKLHIPDKSPENDAWIAASAIEHNLILVTRNIKDYERNDNVKLLNPIDD